PPSPAARILGRAASRTRIEFPIDGPPVDRNRRQALDERPRRPPALDTTQTRDRPHCVIEEYLPYLRWRMPRGRCYPLTFHREPTPGPSLLRAERISMAGSRTRCRGYRRHRRNSLTRVLRQSDASGYQTVCSVQRRQPDVARNPHRGT